MTATGTIFVETIQTARRLLGMEFKVRRPLECPFSRDEPDWAGDWTECVVQEEGVCVEVGKVRMGLPEYCPLRKGSISVTMEKITKRGGKG